MSTIEKPKFQETLIPFKGGRGAFLKIHVAEARKNKDGSTKPGAKKKYVGEILLDPTNAEHAKTIVIVKSESVRALNWRFGTPEIPAPFSVKILEEVASGDKAPLGFHLAWGYGNYLPKFNKKIYDGYKDMFYVKLTRLEEDGRPTLLDRAGNAVKEGDAQCPYSGCVLAGVFSIYSYINESRGVNAQMRTLVYQDKGAAFGKGSVDGAADFAALGDLGGEAAAGGADGSRADFDPFAIT